MWDDDDDGEFPSSGFEPRRWQWSAVGGVAAKFIGNVGRTITALGDDIASLAMQHTAVKYEQDELIQSAQRDLESLPVIDE